MLVLQLLQGSEALSMPHWQTPTASSALPAASSPAAWPRAATLLAVPCTSPWLLPPSQVSPWPPRLSEKLPRQTKQLTERTYLLIHGIWSKRQHLLNFHSLLLLRLTYF